MVEGDQHCGDILIQIAASRSALNNAGGLILENYIKTCLINQEDGLIEEENLDKLIEIMLKYTKQNQYCKNIYIGNKKMLEGKYEP